jgi:Concanavalin A-like lectin/glucanases superfamily
MHRAVALGFGGYVDLDIEFGEFFFQDHTIVLRFMPQHPYAYEGPMLAENGSGTYMVGQANYRDGSGPPDPDDDVFGPSVLFMQVGAKAVRYDVPGFQNLIYGPLGYRNVWQHLAVVREGNTMRLYLNGIHLTGLNAPDLSLPAAGLPSPTTRLRLGRRTTGTGESNVVWQFYGLLDDIGIFFAALTDQKIVQAANSLGLSGQEPGLLAAWTFDDQPLPSAISRQATFPTAADVPSVHNPYADHPVPAYLVDVSPNRDSAADAKMLDIRPSKAHPPNGPPGIRLPFARYDVWAVSQGRENKESHNGYAAFAWDFWRVGAATTTGETVYAAAPGRCISLVDSDPNTGTITDNKLAVEHMPEERASYIHLIQGSYFKHFPGVTLPQNLPAGSQPVFEVGQPLVEVSDHLHFGTVFASPSGVTRGIPNSLSNYFASDDQGATWYRVPLGSPRKCQYIRRALTPNSSPAVASRGVNRLDVFVRVENQHLMYKSWDGSNWTAWKDLGGVLTSGPAAVSWGPDRIDCFGRGQNNHLWRKYWATDTGWSDWEDLGGILTSDPAVASRGPNRLDVFARGQNQHLWYRSWHLTEWMEWKDLGGVLTSAPATVSWGSNRIDCFVQGQNQSLWQKFWNGQWSGWDDEGD